MYLISFYREILGGKITSLFLGNKIQIMNNNSFKKYIFYFLRMFGLVLYYIALPKGDILLVPSLININGELKAFYGYFNKFIPLEGNVVVDGGAYCGLYTIIFSFLVGKNGKVIAFEPDEENFNKLKENIEKYGLLNVVLVKKGLFSKKEKLPFKYGSKMQSSFDLESNAFAKKAEVVSLDQQLEDIGIKKIDFIKMDIEGTEEQALLGAENILKSNNVKLAIASYHIVAGQRQDKKVEEILSKIGYNFETGFKEHLTTYGWK